jgi:hypothetical protein
LTATVFFDSVNELATITATFTNASNAPADPSTVSCAVTDPAAASTVHTFGGAAPADITKVSTGVYQLIVPCSPSVSGVEGLWSYTFIGTGSVADVQPGTWRVLATDQQKWYVGPEELRDRLGQIDATTDSIITSVCLSVSRWIDTYCGRHFFRTTDTRTYQPDNIWLLPIDDLVSVTTLKVDNDGDGVYETTWTQGTNYQLRVGDGQFNQLASGEPKPFTQVQVIGGTTGSSQWFPFTWPFSHLDRVQITGVFGWPQVPPVVTQAALLLASDWFKLKDAPWGVAGIGDIGVIKVNPNPWIAEQLRCYIRGRGKVGV